MMRAAFYEAKGPAREVIRVGEVEVPEPGPGEVGVRVRFSGVNPSDWKGRRRGGMPFDRIIPNQDGSGEISSVGPGVSEDRIGERVWVYEAQLGRPFGTAAEYTAVPSENAVPLPDGVSFEEGASLGVPAMTAHRCLFADGAIHGRTVLVTGGAGAVGVSAVQLGKWAGARVIATVSGEEKARISRRAGADEVINYRDEDVAARVGEITGGEGVDRVVDVAFARNLEANLAAVKPNGTISTYESGGVPEVTLPFYELMSKCVAVRAVLVYAMPKEAHEEAARDINACLRAGAMDHPLADRFGLEETAAAHEAVEGGAVGKVLIEVGA